MICGWIRRLSGVHGIRKLLSSGTGVLPDKLGEKTILSGERMFHRTKSMIGLLDFQWQGSEVGVCGGGTEENCEVSRLDGPLD